MFKHVGKDSGLLFSSTDLRDITDRRLAAMRVEVDSLEPNRLLNTAPADLAGYLVEKYGLEPPPASRSMVG